MAEYFAVPKLAKITSSDKSLLSASFPAFSHLKPSPKFVRSHRHPIILVSHEDTGRTVSALEFHVFAGGVLLLVTGMALVLIVAFILTLQWDFLIVLPFGSLEITISAFLASAVIHFPLSTFMLMNAHSAKATRSFTQVGGIIIGCNVVLLMVIIIVSQVVTPDSTGWRNRFNEEMGSLSTSWKNSFLRAWDSVQNKFGCCGVASPNDWKEARLNLPGSCCQHLTASNCTKWSEKGCSATLLKYHNKYFNFATGIALIAILNNCLSLSVLMVSRWTTTPEPTNRQESYSIASQTPSIQPTGQPEKSDDKSTFHSLQTWVNKIFPEVTQQSRLDSRKMTSRMHSRKTINVNDPVVQIMKSVSGPESNVDMRQFQSEDASNK